MTRYIDAIALGTLVKTIGAEEFIAQMTAYLEDDFRRWQEFDKCPRVASHSPVGVIELMPIADSKLYAFKYVNGHPRNTFRDLLTVMAFGVLADVATGYPLLVTEFTIMTALRTAATSVLAAKYLARRNSRVMAMIGNGAQAEFQAIAFHTLLGITEIRAYDIDADATAKLIRNLAHLPGLRITAAGSARAAAKGADIVTTATADKTNATILTPDMVEPGMHINGVGGDCPGKTELHPDILRQARVVVELEAQTRIEGDIQHLPPDFPVTELWQIISGGQAGRETDAQVTVFDSVGFALEDFSALRYLHDIAEGRNIGQKLSLIPEPADPKDLYSLVHSETVKLSKAG